MNRLSYTTIPHPVIKHKDITVFKQVINPLITLSNRFEALAHGNILKMEGEVMYYKLEGNKLVTNITENNEDWIPISEKAAEIFGKHFTNPDTVYHVYEYKPWFEDLGRYGALCWVYNEDDSDMEWNVDNKVLDIIVSYSPAMKHKYISISTHWQHAILVTKDEFISLIYKE